MASELAAIAPKRDPPIVSYGTQSKHWPSPAFLMKRPARKQVEEFTKRGVVEDMGEYNIWCGGVAVSKASAADSQVHGAGMVSMRALGARNTRVAARVTSQSSAASRPLTPAAHGGTKTPPPTFATSMHRADATWCAAFACRLATADVHTHWRSPVIPGLGVLIPPPHT